MSSNHVFISHASKDDEFVKDLREALESLGLAAWADSRELSGGDKLTPEIESNIENARQFIVVVSLNALNSTWVQNEVKKALEVERRRKSEGYKVIPLMLPGIQPPVLKLLFGEEPVGLRVELETGGVSEALPAGHPEPATQARQHARESYLAYRRGGGQSMNPGAQLCVVAGQGIAQKDTTALEDLLAQFRGAYASLRA